MAISVITFGVTGTDVTNITGASATASDILAADSIVTLYLGRTAAASGSMSPNDLRHIQVAICWQSRWLAGNPNWQSRSEFQQLSQDGLDVSSDAQWSKVLGPLAARSLRNVSWLGSRTEHPASVDLPVGYGPAFFLQGDYDDVSGGDWESLPID